MATLSFLRNPNPNGWLATARLGRIQEPTFLKIKVVTDPACICSASKRTNYLEKNQAIVQITEKPTQPHLCIRALSFHLNVLILACHF
jgi:hypothetical protein